MKLKYTSTILAIVIGIISIFISFFDLKNIIPNDTYISLVTIYVVVIFIILFYYFFIRALKKEHEEDVNKKYEEIKNSVIPEESNSEQNFDILKLMLANMREINDYYVLSKTQAQNAFILAVITCVIGIVLMGVSIFAAFFYTSNVVSAIVPAVGAAIVEVIAATSLFVYKKSLSQLNHYFNSLHSNERFLSIVNIVSKASPEVQDDMYFEIIKSQIGLVSTDLIEHTNDENNV